MSDNVNQNSINPGLVSNSSIRNDTLNASFTGTTDDAVLRWAAAGTQVGTAFTETTVAADGTVITCLETGLYHCVLICDIVGALNLGIGIGHGLTGVALTANPLWANAGMVAAFTPITGVAALVGNNCISGVCPIDNASIAAGTNTIRFICTNSANAVPAAVTLASVAYRIQKIGNLA